MENTAQQASTLNNAPQNSDEPTGETTHFLNAQNGLKQDAIENHSEEKEKLKQLVQEGFKCFNKTKAGSIDEFCSLQATLISNESFWDITYVWKHFDTCQEYFWSECGDQVWKNDCVTTVKEKYEKLADDSEDGKNHILVKKLFSYLMHDWYNPEPNKTYALVTKIDKFDDNTKGRNLIKILLDISEHPSYTIYRYVVLRIFYQYLYELGKPNVLKDDGIYRYMNMIMNYVFMIKNHEIKISCVKIGTVFWLLSCEDKIKKIIRQNLRDALERHISELNENDEQIRIFKETKKFCELCFLLVNKKSSLSTFQDAFERFLEFSVQTYGDFSTIAMNSYIQLLLFMASKENLYSFSDFLLRKFPEFPVNSTIMLQFEKVRDFKSFKVRDFNATELQQIVSTSTI